MKNINIKGIGVIIAGTTLILAVALGSAFLKVLTYEGLVAFDSGRLQWLTSEWFSYAMAGIAVSLIPVTMYICQPPEQRYRFQASSLNWHNLLNAYLIAVSVFSALVRNNIPAGIFFVCGVVAIGMMWIGVNNGIPALGFNGGLLTLAILYLGAWGRLVTMEPTILIGAVPAYGIMTAYWTPEVFSQSETPIQFILLPILPAILFLLIWIPAQYGLLRLRKRYACQPRLGPFVETLTFISLAAPWLAAAYFFPTIFMNQENQDNQVIASCVTVLMGLVWSKLISDPFAKFVRSIL